MALNRIFLKKNKKKLNFFEIKSGPFVIFMEELRHDNKGNRKKQYKNLGTRVSRANGAYSYGTFEQE